MILVFHYEDLCGLAGLLRWTVVEMHGAVTPHAPLMSEKLCNSRIRRLPEKEPGTYG